ncbi:MlaC/ttg2D family ABC transporter substrate-binding protein [Tahibacter amnicola]|uniref:ABC transporter substrate-binding protein n=1 Tax=Tahibacter amnicola TaxID=2976241 RepID=A0ABY6BCX4_9GAMM|nr:ABC transporter substrate-binding protein [Tahibacter amnicola]UXI67893.1 ABC transporter substrate-binding protein [Tahibacter amnicola]
MMRSLIFAFAASLFAAVGTVQAAPAEPNAVVQGIADDLGSALEGRKDELRNDRDKLIKLIDQIVLPHFDIDYASILVLGQNARAATPQQRARFAKAFYDSIAHRYAEGLLNYTRGRINITPYKGELNDKRSLVRTEVILDDGKRVPVDYVFHKTREGEWKAYDVVIEGISYVSNYRNQVAAEIQKSGLDALIARLETQGSKALESLENTKS